MHTTYKKYKVLEMIEQEFEDFEKDRENSSKGLKTIVDFGVSKIEYEGTTIKTQLKPKFKAKIKSSVYIKPNSDSKNSLF
jgi:hypothetical protein